MNTHPEPLYIRQYYGHFEMIILRLVKQQFYRSIINSYYYFCASRSSLHFTNLLCVKCITVYISPPALYIYISGHWETSNPYTHSTRLCFTTDRQFYYSTTVPCELNLNVLLMANVCRLVKFFGHSVIVLGPINKENKLLKLSWQAHISNSWIN